MRFRRGRKSFKRRRRGGFKRRRVRAIKIGFRR